MSSSRFDPSPPDRSPPEERWTGGFGTPGPTRQEKGVADSISDPSAPDGANLLNVIGRAMQVSRDYQQRTIQRPLSRAYRAWQNIHAEGSKYLGTAWRGRSRLFVPKTRSAVRKNLATAAGALFSTEDVVNVSAQFEDDNQQRATAAVIKADLDYRLTRASAKSGIPWYQIAMGGCLDGQLTGVTISKQYWEYEEIHTGAYHTKEVPAIDEETGQPLYEQTHDLASGQMVVSPVMDQIEDRDSPVMRVIKDRPMIELMPIENAGLDPAAPWYSPVQLGRWFYMRFPMGLSDVRAMMASGNKPPRTTGAGNNGQMQNYWLDVSNELLLKGRVEEDRSGSRRVREGGSDRYQDARVPGELDIVWIQENFVRIGGKDYHFWSVGRHGCISKVRETRDAYPEFDGERPYVMGVSQLDTHRVFPQSPVDTWQPLQLELNDIANLRLDSLKRSISPLVLYKLGKKVDLTSLQRRGQPDAMVGVDSIDDVMFQQTPGPTGASYTETSVTNASFDELAGVFSTSSVQTSRQLNETVGGMRLMSGSANAVSEFDLRMWAETWVEPTLRQLVHLVRYNESDEVILAVAGQRARAWTRFQYLPNLSDFEQTQVTLTVNVGIGALDPMQRLAKFKMAGEMLAPLYPMMQKVGITPNVEAMIEEVMGHAGYKDGRRFFNFGQAPPDQGAAADPKLQIAQLQIASKEKMDAADNETKLKVEAMAAKSEMVRHVVEAMAEREARQHGMIADSVAQAHDHAHDRHSQIHDFAAAHASRVHDTLAQQQESTAQRHHSINELLTNGAMRRSEAASKPAAQNGGKPSSRSAMPQPQSSGPSMDDVMSRLEAQEKRNAGLEAALKEIMRRMLPAQPRMQAPGGQPPPNAPAFQAQ